MVWKLEPLIYLFVFFLSPLQNMWEQHWSLVRLFFFMYYTKQEGQNCLMSLLHSSTSLNMEQMGIISCVREHSAPNKSKAI